MSKQTFNGGKKNMNELEQIVQNAKELKQNVKELKQAVKNITEFINMRGVKICSDIITSPKFLSPLSLMTFWQSLVETSAHEPEKATTYLLASLVSGIAAWVSINKEKKLSNHREIEKRANFKADFVSNDLLEREIRLILSQVAKKEQTAQIKRKNLRVISNFPPSRKESLMR